MHSVAYVSIMTAVSVVLSERTGKHINPRSRIVVASLRFLIGPWSRRMPLSSLVEAANRDHELEPASLLLLWRKFHRRLGSIFAFVSRATDPHLYQGQL